MSGVILIDNRTGLGYSACTHDMSVCVFLTRSFKTITAVLKVVLVYMRRDLDG